MTVYQVYFCLQKKRWSRFANEQGLSLISLLSGAILVAVALFYVLYIQLGSNSIYLLLCMFFLLSYRMASRQEMDFYDLILNTKDYNAIRLSEQYLMGIPILLGAIYLKQYWAIVLIFTWPILLVFLPFKQKNHTYFPTPFGRNPFEYIIGFRKGWLLLVACFCLALIAIKVGNLNLGLFALMASYWIGMSFYGYKEPITFVWKYTSSSKSFLQQKTKQALINSMLVSFWISLGLIIAFPSNWFWVLLINLLGLLYVVLGVLTKYAYYPKEMSILQGIIIALTFLFPPLLFLFVPYFYYKSIQNIKSYLG